MHRNRVDESFQQIGCDIHLFMLDSSDGLLFWYLLPLYEPPITFNGGEVVVCVCYLPLLPHSLGLDRIFESRYLPRWHVSGVPRRGPLLWGCIHAIPVPLAARVAARQSDRHWWLHWDIPARKEPIFNKLSFHWILLITRHSLE